jgi:hypothetical protein
MSTYHPNQLWQLWQREEIDSTMVVGYMLQNLVLQQEAITKLNISLIQVKQELDQVKQQPKLSTPPKPTSKHNQ